MPRSRALTLPLLALLLASVLPAQRDPLPYAKRGGERDDARGEPSLIARGPHDTASNPDD
jgi:hypothetical protein